MNVSSVASVVVVPSAYKDADERWLLVRADQPTLRDARMMGLLVNSTHRSPGA